MISFQQLLSEEPTTDAFNHQGGVLRSVWKQTSQYSLYKENLCLVGLNLRSRDLNSKNQTIFEDFSTPWLLEIKKAQHLLCSTVLCQRDGKCTWGQIQTDEQMVSSPSFHLNHFFKGRLPKQSRLLPHWSKEALKENACSVVWGEF